MINSIIFTTLLVVITLPLTTILKINAIPINFLPVQFALLLCLLYKFYDLYQRHLIDILLFDLCLVGIVCIVNVLINGQELTGIYHNRVVVFLVVLAIWAQPWPLKLEAQVLLDQILNYFFIFFLGISLLLLGLHIRQYGSDIRFKGFGSGTLHALLAMLCLLYYTDKYKFARLGLVRYLVVFSLAFTILLKTGSRGCFVFTIAALTLTAWKNIRATTVVYGLAAILVPLLLVNAVDIADVPLLKRFIFSNYCDWQTFTSGRLISYQHILRWFWSQRSWNSVLFGSGLNSMKDFVATYDICFPHFDILYILYEGGFVLLGVYGYLFYKAIRYSRYYLYPLLIFANGLHTNMLASPNMIMIFIMLADANFAMHRQAELRIGQDEQEIDLDADGDH